jgi:hypothetical protein
VPRGAGVSKKIRFFEKIGFLSWGIEVETEREVFSRSRKIDLVVTCTDANQKQLQSTRFAHFRQVNALELKGFHDPLTVADYNLIIMRAWGLGVPKAEKLKSEDDSSSNSDEDDSSEPALLANQITVTIVCVRRPNKILNQLGQAYRLVKTEAGIVTRF